MTRVIKGLDQDGNRIDSFDFEHIVRQAAEETSDLTLESYGQHNIGIRLHRDDGLHLLGVVDLSRGRDRDTEKHNPENQT